MPDKRLPTVEDFPKSLTLTVTSPPSNQAPVNILILIHGMGDTHLPFATLGTQLNLPSTACIAVKGHNPLPFESTSFHWCDDIIFDSSTQGLDPDGGFKTSTSLLVKDIIDNTLLGKCGYSYRDIVLFGLGQGGMAALNAAVTIKGELGGVVSIGGPLPNEATASLSPKSKTPALVCSGTNSRWVSSSAEEKLKHVFESLQLSRYRRSGDTMPKDRDEMLPIMQFFARRLRQAPPKGTTELT